MKSKPYKGKRPDLKCTHCHNLGHTVGRCWTLHPELKRDFDKEKGPQRGYEHRAHAAACTTGKIPSIDAMNFSSNPAALLSDFATYLKEKSDTISADSSTSDPTALLGQFADMISSPAPISSNEETASPINSYLENSDGHIEINPISDDSTSSAATDNADFNAFPANNFPSSSNAPEVLDFPRMETKKLGLVLGISAIVAAFTMILHLLEAPEVQHPSPLLLNITSCHESMRRSDLLYVKFDVYVNVVNETIMNPRLREFAGTFVHIDPGVIRVAREANLETLRKKTDLKLGISEVLEDLEADGDDIIWVTSVSRSKGCINAIVDGLRIEYIN
ncbi:hypothetical protein DKX38_006295 [Salix brachista]|uniref:Polyphenol oxidase C-terminal domain-containing protein n=1 Tax=Salix brachista TaxID=2182728 RepID=A0A5N5N2W5_9ROSI|nr:hypothetical protein DKX38_006295 [Salix brachista]